MKVFKAMNKAIKKGFTLVELVIVIAVIAVLSAVLIPVFGNVVKDARVSSLKASLKACTSNLMMYATYNQVDYYTPAVIRDFLESEGIKGLKSGDSEFCEDGYSIWYNQENFNLSLVKNEDLASYVASGSPSAGVSGGVATYSVDIFGNLADATQTVGTDIGASSQLKKLPRRPEALTPNENLLLLATDESNKSALEAIETMYTGLDAGNVGMTPEQVIDNVANLLDSCDLLKNSNDSSQTDKWTSSSYTEKFSPEKTAWLANNGKFYTGAKFEEVDDKNIAYIENVIVSPNLGTAIDAGEKDGISGEIYNANGEKKVGAYLNVSCVIEIATANDVKLGNGFFESLGNRGANIVVSGNVSISAEVSSVSSGVTMTTVSTVTGGGRNISSAVTSGGGSAVTGGGGSKTITQTISADDFKKWTTGKDGAAPLVACSNVSKVYKDGEETNQIYVSVRTENGEYVKQAADADFFNNSTVTVDGKTEAVQYKYNETSFSINVKGSLAQLDITDKTAKSVTIKVYERSYNSVNSTSVYVEYEGTDGKMYGKSINFGVGYITTFDHYYRYYNPKFTKEETGANTTPVYSSIPTTETTTEETTTDAGSVAIKLPDGAFNLQSYKNDDFTIEVYYHETTDYYKEIKSDFGFGTYYKRVATLVSTEEKSLIQDNNCQKVKLSDGSYLFSFGSHNIIKQTEAFSSDEVTHFVNTVQIDRIIIKDNIGNVLIAKYPTVAETASGTTAETTETTSGSAA